MGSVCRGFHLRLAGCKAGWHGTGTQQGKAAKRRAHRKQEGAAGREETPPSGAHFHSTFGITSRNPTSIQILLEDVRLTGNPGGHRKECKRNMKLVGCWMVRF